MTQIKYDLIVIMTHLVAECKCMKQLTHIGLTVLILAAQTTYKLRNTQPNGVKRTVHCISFSNMVQFLALSVLMLCLTSGKYCFINDQRKKISFVESNIFHGYVRNCRKRLEENHLHSVDLFDGGTRYFICL